MVLVLAADDELSSTLIQRLARKTPNIVTVRQKGAFRRISSSQYEMNLSAADHYVRLLDSLHADSIQPHNVLHLWSLSRLDPDSKNALQIQQSDIYGLVFLAKALAQQNRDYDVSISIISNGMFQIESSDKVMPERITMFAPSIIIPKSMKKSPADVSILISRPPQPRQPVTRYCESWSLRIPNSWIPWYQTLDS